MSLKLSVEGICKKLAYICDRRRRQYLALGLSDGQGDAFVHSD